MNDGKSGNLQRGEALVPHTESTDAVNEMASGQPNSEDGALPSPACGVGPPNTSEIQAYLKEHPALGELIPRVCTAACKEFGPDAEISLQLYRDPEIDDSYLTLYVRLANYDAQTIPRIAAVSAPFNSELENISGYLLLTTDFRRPGDQHAV